MRACRHTTYCPTLVIKKTHSQPNIIHQPIVAPTNYHYKKVIPKQNILNLISNKIKVQYCVFNLVKIFVKEFNYLEKWKHTCQCMSFIMKSLSCTSIVNFSINTLIYPDIAHCGILYIKRNRLITSFVARQLLVVIYCGRPSGGESSKCDVGLAYYNHLSFNEFIDLS